GQAAIISVPITVGETASETAVTVENLRTDLVAVTPTGVVLEVTGGPAFGADIASAFKGANMTLLMVTILIVAILLIATYRSPVLWLVPLVVV
ncbi:MMPL family transporter, partial [Klebsiella pneumoniae]|uniref:MMPL family transporter n=2 Tax=Bacteria TaxID=2 RepID=UPI0030136428